MIEVKGLALLCNADGIITEVLVDTLPLDNQPRAGLPLDALFDGGSQEKVAFLVDEIRARGGAFGWELTASLRGVLRTLHVGGGAAGAQMLLLASVSSRDVGKLYEQLMEINNEQSNAFRRVMKDHVGVLGEGAARDAKLYEEIARLNAELATQQRELAKKNALLQSLIDQRDELLGMAAHDLRNPLGAVLNFAQFLADELEPELSEEHRGFLETIQSLSRFMLNMVNDLLDISKIAAGKLELNRIPFDVAALVEQKVVIHRPLARKKGIALFFERDSDVLEAEVDTERMDQVFNNLISNAIKYSHPGSRVDVYVRCGAAGGIVIGVRDQGVGIPSDKLDRLFRPFGRLASGGTAGETSTGLGLAIARKIVEAHRARIDVESEVGVGSLFTVTLPA